jgi:hypothetical protein
MAVDTDNTDWSNRFARTQRMLSTAESFCNAFVAGSKPSEMLDAYFSPTGSITEHGPLWANARLPFLAKTFSGRRASDVQNSAEPPRPEKTTCDDYFDLLGATISFHPHEKTLPAREGYVVDPDTVIPGSEGRGVVMVRAHAKLGGVETGQSWEEEFVFVFSGFGEEMKIGRMEIWADNLSAWKGVEG